MKKEVQKYQLTDKENQRIKNPKSTFSRLLRYLKNKKGLLVLTIISTIIATVLTVIAPNIMGLITTSIGETVSQRFDGVEAAIDYAYILRIIGILLAMYIGYSLLNYIQNIAMGAVSQDIVYAMREDIDHKLMNLPVSFYDYNKAGDILSRVTNDVNTISNTLQQSVTTFLSAIVQITGIIFMMFRISKMMTLVVFFTIPVSALVVKKIAGRSREYFKEQQDILGDLNSDIEEIYGAHGVVKAYGLENENIQNFEKKNSDLREAGKWANFFSGLTMPLMNFINNIGYVVVAIAGGYYVLKGQIKIGQMQAFMQYSKNFTQPINQIGEMMNMIQSTLASAERVFEIIDVVDDVDKGKIVLDPEKVTGRVAFEHVDFGYYEDEILIHDLNIEAKPNQMVAIVGPTGAGKSTLVNLLMRFYEINSGDITIDGISIYDIKKASLRRNFAMVLQDTWLFKGSIKDNIRYGSDHTDEEVIEAAKAAQADYFIRTLPNGYDTIINEEASNISEGQKQLLTIARAFLTGANMLILDEATSSVDTRTENLIQKAMDNLMEGKTSFVIAHRLSTIVNADLILVMNHGDIIEQGSHQELLNKNGFYADLYNSQFEE
ncbi:MAG: ABC transporter ATP-binding protein [Tissierellia bacterium]|nr:ABC transporter ATP-binding protein [Tissierellia bacterium]